MTKTGLLIILIGFYSSALVIGQEKITHPKTMYQSPEGKLYVQKLLPIYLRIANSPDENAKSYLLQSHQTAAYANPMYLDTEGFNTVRSPSAVDTVTKKVVYPEKDIIFEVYADSYFPSSKALYNKEQTFTKQNKVYIQGGLEIELKATDAMSGVNKIYFSLDEAPFKEYTSSISLDSEKEYTLKFYAIDNVGNDEEINTIVFVVDKSKPEANIEINGDNHEDVISGTSSVKIIASDNNTVKNIFYTLDNHSEKTFTYAISAKYLTEGDHVLKYYAVDEVNNKGEERVYNFFVDKTPPTVVEEIVGNSIIVNGQEFSSGRSKLKLTTFDNKAGVKEIYYSINGGEYELYTKPVVLSSSSGKLKIQSYALDYVNNKSTQTQETSKNNLPYIDLTGPILKHSFSGPVFTARDSVYINKNTKIALLASDAESGLNKISYSIDNGDISEYTEPFGIENEGMHKISINAADKVDNTNSNSFYIVVDNSGPAIFSRYSVPSINKKIVDNESFEVYPNYVVLFLSATDQVPGFDKMYYSINKSAEKPYSGLISNFSINKEYEIKIRALDKLGNDTEQIVKFYTDVN